MDELLGEFLTETNESLSQLDQDIVKLEKNPEDPELLGVIFRVMHTIKGTCGFLGLPRLEKVAHHGENILGKFRDGEMAVDEEAVSIVLESLDRIKDIVDALGQTGEEPVGEDSDIINKIEAFIDVRLHGGAPTVAAAEPEEEIVMVEEGETIPAAPLDSIEEEIDFTPIPADQTRAAVEALESEEAEKADTPVEETVEEAEEDEPAPVETKAQGKKTEDSDVKKEAPVVAQSIRVNVDLLENLMTVASELVLTRNQLIQLLRQQTDSDFAAPLQRLNHNVTELQEHVMKTRMQPIGNAWAKLPRIIRDLANELKKDIELVMEGEDTELDRQVLELIKDPLTHMVRNSADHGLEIPADRKKAGKVETGTIHLSAYHEGGHIIIEIADDGRGLAVDKIKKKAIENGVATAEELGNYSTQQINNLIFHPGLSTAEKVTSVSGRGVGMDVVKSNIEKIGGTIELFSQTGKGTKVQVKIPLTLAIVSALIVEASGERFAIPQISVLELVRSSQEGENRIEEIQGSPVLRLRNKLLPLVSLSKLLHLEGGKELYSSKKKNKRKENDLRSGIASLQKEEKRLMEAIEKEDNPKLKESNIKKLEEIALALSDSQEVLARLTEENSAEKHTIKEEDPPYIIVTQVGNYTFGIIVDQVYDTEEIVVKPVSPILRHISMFSGNTILGDGTVIMILDPNGIAQQTGEITVGDDTSASMGTENGKRRTRDDSTSLLVFKAGSGAPKAVPLSLVGRLEDFKVEEIEVSEENRMVIQYRGGLMPLVPFAQNYSFPESGRQAVLVFADEKRSMGLMVDEIIDIVDEQMKVETSGVTPGILGSAIISGKATNVIDVGYYLSQANNDWFDTKSEQAYTDGQKRGKRLLLVDDSPFFRNMLKPLLEVGGFEVITQQDPHEALGFLEQDYDFDIIVSDIEMPGMSGFDFASSVRTKEELNHVPIIALSSHATTQDMDRGKESGFDNYVAKFDREALLSAIEEALSHTKAGEAA